MINIQIKNSTNFKFKYKRLYKKVVKTTCDLLNVSGKTELTVIIVDNNEMQRISNDTRGKNKPTDILSFPTGYKDLKSLIGYNLLGDIFLSYEMIAEQAAKFGHTLKREWTYMFTHGLLHLLGYDHKTKEEENEMNGLAYKVMDILKVGKDA